MSGVRALAVWVAALGLSTVAVAAGSVVSAGHVGAVRNPHEARSGARHGVHARSRGVHHVTGGNHGHGGGAAGHAGSAGSRHVGAAKLAAKNGGGHKTARSGAQRALAGHNGPHSRDVGSSAHAHARAEPKRVKVKSAAAQPAPHPRESVRQAVPTRAEQPHAQAIQSPQALPPILR